MAVLVLNVDHRVAAVALGAGGGGVDVLPMVLHVIDHGNRFSHCTLHFSSFGLCNSVYVLWFSQ
jgi:hypothetical protein